MRLITQLHPQLRLRMSVAKLLLPFMPSASTRTTPLPYTVFYNIYSFHCSSHSMKSYTSITGMSIKMEGGSETG
jgi:hypothetical protein